MAFDRRSVLLAAGSVVTGASGLGFLLPGSAPRLDGRRQAPGLLTTQTPTVSNLRPGTRLGPENNAYFFSGATSGSRAQGTDFGGLGPKLVRAIELPPGYANIPSTGDHWLVLFFRTAAVSCSRSRQETLLGVQGFGATASAGGALSFSSPTQAVGGPTGQTIAHGAGTLLCQRVVGGFSLWPQGATPVSTSVVVAPDTPYALFFGIHGDAGVDHGKLMLISLLDLSCQSAQSPLPLAKVRPTAAPMFDRIGALGSAGPSVDAQGFGGDVGDFAVFKAPFPTLSQARGIASGGAAAIGTSATLANAKLLYWNALDATQMTGDSLPAAVGPPAHSLGANLISCAPMACRSTLTLLRLGNHYVFPLAPGARSGSVWFEGTAPAGAIVECRLNYLDGTVSGAARATVAADGSFVASVRSPGGKPFRRQAILIGAVSTSYVDGDIMDVGIVVALLGQSEVNLLTTWLGAPGLPETPGSDFPSGNAGHSLKMPGAYTGPWASWIDCVDLSTGGCAPRRSLNSSVRPQILLGSGLPGDGAVQATQALIAALGYSVMLVMLTRSGTPMDAVLYDGQTFTTAPVLSGKGVAASPFAGVLAIKSRDVAKKFGKSALSVVSTFVNGVAPGSVTLTFQANGASIKVTDQFSGYSDAGVCRGVLSGDGGAVGVIDYMTGAFSVAFASVPPNSTLSASWTVSQEVQASAYLAKSADINGWGVRQAFDQVASLGLRHGWTLTWHWWITSNLPEVTTEAATTSLLSAKISLLQERLTGGDHYPGYIAPGLAVEPSLASPKMVIAPKGRETPTSTPPIFQRLDIARRAQAALWPSGSASLPFVLPGGWYYDNAVDAVPSSPHEDHSDLGARRVGRRAARDWIAAFTGDRSINRGPEWGAPSFQNAVCTVPVSYIGAGLRLVTLGNPLALDEWYMGTASSVGVRVDNADFATAAIRADGLAVVITRRSGHWLGNEVVRYVLGGPGQGFAPPASLLYDNRGGFGGFEPGLLATPKFA